MLGEERDASASFLDQLLRLDRDNAFVIHFDFEVELLQDLTSSRQKLRAALDELELAERGGSATALIAVLTLVVEIGAAGWVAGLCEAMLRRPKVRDFEALPEDIVTFRGFWRNGITRILLVVALANLGSSIGTFVGLPLMTRLLG